MRKGHSCLTSQIVYQGKILQGKMHSVPKDTDALASGYADLEAYTVPCNHEEAETRLILPDLYCAKIGYR